MSAETISTISLVVSGLSFILLVNLSWYIKSTYKKLEELKELYQLKDELKQVTLKLEQEMINNRAFINQLKDNEVPLNVRMNKNSGAFWVDDKNYPKK
jgi:hypothetical protein